MLDEDLRELLALFASHHPATSATARPQDHADAAALEALGEAEAPGGDAEA